MGHIGDPQTYTTHVYTRRHTHKQTASSTTTPPVLPCLLTATGELQSLSWMQVFSKDPPDPLPFCRAAVISEVSQSVRLVVPLMLNHLYYSLFIQGLICGLTVVMEDEAGIYDIREVIQIDVHCSFQCTPACFQSSKSTFDHLFKRKCSQN